MRNLLFVSYLLAALVPLSTAFGAEYVLAASWQPAFCEGRAGKRAPECRSQTAGRYDASRFSLHGLWPQPRGNVYCGISAAEKADDMNRRWHLLPPSNVSPGTRRMLDRVMPGTQSHLDRHEWIKHGACYPGTAEEYFARSVMLMEQLNNSAVRDLFANSIGMPLTRGDIRAAFAEAFGMEVADRVSVSCKNDGARVLISELKINLAGEISNETDLGVLMRAAAPAPTIGCRGGGIVDPVGLQ